MYADLVGEMDQQMQEKVHRKSNGIDIFDRFVNDVFIRTPRSTTRTLFVGWVCVCVWKMDLSRLGNVLLCNVVSNGSLIYSSRMHGF